MTPTNLAQICYFAQSHVSDPESWTSNISKRHDYFTTVDFTIACFLTHNTPLGRKEGVECNIIIDDLANTALSENGMMELSQKQWENIINKLVEDLGGWDGLDSINI